MHTFQKTAKPISILAIILLFLMSTLNQPAAAAMVGTENLLISDRNQETRRYLQQMMSRKDIQEALVARGVDLQEAQIRIDSLTDREIVNIRLVFRFLKIVRDTSQKICYKKKHECFSSKITAIIHP